MIQCCCVCGKLMANDGTDEKGIDWCICINPNCPVYNGKQKYDPAKEGVL